MIIHVITKNGGAVAPSTTLCGRTGQYAGERVYHTPQGQFVAVLASDTMQGPTCEKCRLIGKAKRTKGPKE